MQNDIRVGAAIASDFDVFEYIYFPKCVVCLRRSENLHKTFDFQFSNAMQEVSTLSERSVFVEGDFGTLSCFASEAEWLNEDENHEFRFF